MRGTPRWDDGPHLSEKVAADLRAGNPCIPVVYNADMGIGWEPPQSN